MVSPWAVPCCVGVTITGTAPGPLLRFKEGEHIWVRVYNDMPSQNTTIHWHGFSQYLSPFSDGTPQASGWPIPPGHFYDYEFQLVRGGYGPRRLMTDGIGTRLLRHLLLPLACRFPDRYGLGADHRRAGRWRSQSGAVRRRDRHAHGRLLARGPLASCTKDQVLKNRQTTRQSSRDW